MDGSKALANTAESGGPSTISVVVTTVPTPASLTSSDARRRASPIKLVGLGGLERQNYCCGHWFPSSKSYHRHLAERAPVDLTHEVKLVERGMLRCAHCSMWVHVDSMSGHLRKSHGILKVAKASKGAPGGDRIPAPQGNAGDRVVPPGAAGNGGRDALKAAATNFVIKVSGQAGVGDGQDPDASAKPGAVKLVTTSAGGLYREVFHRAPKVVVRRSTSIPVVNMGSRIVMKSSVVPLKQIVGAAPNGIAAVQIPGGNVPSCSVAHQSQEEKKMNGQDLMKKIASVKAKSKLFELSKTKLIDLSELSKSKLIDLQPADCNKLAVCAKANKGKGVPGEGGSLKPSKKSRKQVLKPNLPDANCVAEAPRADSPVGVVAEGAPFLEVKAKKRGRKRSVHPEFGGAEGPHRRKLKEAPDNENYTPKTTRQAKNVGRGWKKKKRGPGRPRKIRLDETPDLSEIDSLFEELDKEDLENEPVLKTKKEEENVPTVELDLFTLPSLNEQMSVLLTEPHNPNFKVYASMDAIFVGDSALGDVTNQIGYVTDANNVVYVNPGHFLFPNVEDLENFVPSPILTVKGNKVGFTPARQMWKLNPNKSLTPVVLRESKYVNGSSSRDAPGCFGDEREAPSVAQRQRVGERAKSSAEGSPGDKVLQKSLRVSDARQSNEPKRRDDVPTTSLGEAGGTTFLSPQREPSSHQAEVAKTPKVSDVKKQRRKSSSHAAKKERSKTTTHKGDAPAVSDPLEPNRDVESQSRVQVEGVAPSQEVESQGPKSPWKSREAPGSASEANEVTKSPALRSLEGTEVGIARPASPCRHDPKNSTKLDCRVPTSPSKGEEDDAPNPGPEGPVASPMKTKDLLPMASPEATEDATPPVQCKDVPTLSPRRMDGDSSAARPEEGTSSPAPPDAPKRRISSTRRRRRSRTKSAETFLTSAEVHKDAEIPGDAPDAVADASDCGVQLESSRRPRRVSESSAKEPKGNRISIAELRERLRLKRLQARVRRKNRKDVEAKCIVDADQNSYPVTPRKTKESPASVAARGDPPEEAVGPASETPCRVTPSGLPERKPRGRRRRRKRRTNALESLGVEPLEAPASDVEERVRERLMGGEREGAPAAGTEGSSGDARAEGRPGIACVPLAALLEGSPRHRKRSTKGEDATPPREGDFSPSREWHGRGAKLKAQVLIQDQQAGVIDSQIVPNGDVPAGGPRSSSPKKAPTTLPCGEAPRATPDVARSPASPKASRSPGSVQDREWQARGAKLKAQVMISDQQRNAEEFSEEASSRDSLDVASSSPPAKRVRAEASPGTRDIRTYFTPVQASPVCKEEGPQPAPQARAPPKKRKHSFVKNDIRSYLSPGRRKNSPQRPRVKAEGPSPAGSPKRMPKKKDVRAVVELRREFELLEDRLGAPGASPPSAPLDFEGFEGLPGRSGLESLARIVSLMGASDGWRHSGRHPFPVDHLCEWDDEVLTSMIFEAD